MKPVSHLIGQRFCKLTVVEDLGTRKGGKFHFWRCVCDCGGQIDVAQDHLVQGLTKSCGCLHDSIGRENLRLVKGTSVTKLEKRRGKLNAGNRSGYNGVYEQNSHGRRTGRWNAQIGFCGKRYFLGTFDTPEEAAKAREEAEKRLYDGFLEWYYQKNIFRNRKPERSAKICPRPRSARLTNRSESGGRLLRMLQRELRLKLRQRDAYSAGSFFTVRS